MTLRGLPDAARIKECLDEQNVNNVVFIGAGFISMEIASLLAEKNSGLNINIIELMDRPLPLMLDKDMGDVVGQYLEEKGLKILTGEKVEKLVGDKGKVIGIQLASGKILDADIVFMNVGVRPNIHLVESVGLEMGQFGIKVN